MIYRYTLITLIMILMMMMMMMMMMIKSNQIKSNRERYVDTLGPRHRCIEGQLTPSHLACLSIFLNYI